ncbi:aminotransferase class IV [Clostridium celatum]|uniref:Aminotransferase, class IV n=1 Tax=Clostridium celatum DSM 1785 TaxID=545697 RepID=L1QN28_9CLOT|nr:aminotransferase class IV [Clostridium celatum]EKY29378.1 aminotransferase, class IV [Clostridium celatum DSM 1785]MCE9655372.1 aminotransferase class IV [Clostridium celatum]MDU2266180.1 aminotransferase class IV [Clostridium celatum]MDU3723060.1 aminotransferase class IV [Clostridium celatum]MDU6296477.1 aminotransferase class IV [Clostridium celatum]
MEAINKFYLNNGDIFPIEKFTDEDYKEKIIYEVLRVVNGKPAFLKDHLERMKKSFKLIHKEFPFNDEKIKELIDKVIKANDDVIGNIKITYNTTSGNFKIYYIMHSYPSAEYYKKGIKTILYYGERENPNLKIVSTDFRAKIAEKMKEANAHEALLVDRNGFITEGSKSNFFGIKDGKLITAKAEHVLKGITRDKIFKIANELGIKIEEKEVKASEVGELDAVFISGTSVAILPIEKIDNIKFDVNNEVLRKIMNIYEELLEGKREI